MAAPSQQQVGVDFLIRALGTILEGQETANLSRPTNQIDVTHKRTGRYQKNVDGIREWEMSYEGVLIGPDGEELSGEGTTLEVVTGTDADGNPVYEALSASTSYSLELAMEIIDRTSNDSGRWRELLPGMRSWSISAEAGYIDPASSAAAAYEAFIDAQAAGEQADVRLTLPTGATFTGLVGVADAPLEMPRDDRVTKSLDLTGSGMLSHETSSTLDAGLDALIGAYSSDPPSTVDLAMMVQDAGGTNISGATRHSGTAYISELSMELPYDDRATVSGTFPGDGPLATDTQA